MKFEIENLLIKKCKNKKVYIYGAGDWAESVYLFLLQHKIIIEGFCVSDGQKKEASFETDLPVYCISEINICKDCFFVVSLAEKWHDSVISVLKAAGVNQYYALSKEQERELEKIPNVVTGKIISIIVNNKTVDKILNTDYEYEQLFHEITEKYKKIIIRRIGDTIGGALLSLYYTRYVSDMNADYYYVYMVHCRDYPFTHEFKFPNETLFLKFKGDNYEAINRRSIAFWQFVLRNHIDEIEIDNQYDYAESVMKPVIRLMHDGLFRNNDIEEIDYSKKENEFGATELKRMGVKGKYCCVFVRDSGYYKKTWSTIDKQLEIMDEYRNSDVSLLSDAVSWLLDNDYQAIRLGKYSEQSCHEKCVINYADDYHSDFMDFYLAEHSSFYLGDHSGALFFHAFRNVPIAITNYPLITSYDDGTFPFVRERDLIIYHKFYDPKKKRLLTLSEILEIEDCSDEDYKYSGSVKVFEKYYERGIKPIPNTKEEIRNLASEMIERIEGRAHYSEEDIKLRQKYWDILMPYVKERPKVFWIDAEVGIDFLRNNLWLTK